MNSYHPHVAKIIAAGVPADLAADVLALAHRDGSTNSPVGRLLCSENYREQCIAAAKRDRAAAEADEREQRLDAAGECEHGERGGLVATRAGTPRCPLCRAAGYTALAETHTLPTSRIDQRGERPA